MPRLWGIVLARVNLQLGRDARRASQAWASSERSQRLGKKLLA